MELDCLMYEDVYFDYVDELNNIHCYIQQEFNKTSVIFNQDGTATSHTKSKCVIFPKGKTTWEDFVPPFKEGDVIYVEGLREWVAIVNSCNDNGIYDHDALENKTILHFPDNLPLFRFSDNPVKIHLAIEEEKKKIFDYLKEQGYKWNANTNTLEKLRTMKEIHFYKDLKDCDLANFVERDEYHVSYNSTKRAIKENEKLIHTTAISALDFSWLLDKGYKIYLHENGKVGEVYEGVTELTDKELRKGHDIRKIWIGGGFEDYFYGKE